MNITKDQWTKIIGIVLGAAIAIAAVLGWVLPLPAAPGAVGSQSLGVQRFNQAVQFLMPSTFLGAETHSGTETHSGATTITSLTATTITATTVVSQAIGFDTTGDGTAAAPAYTFASDPNTGLYSVAANDIGVSTNGVLAFDVSATAVSSALPVYLPVAGTVSLPALTFTGDVDSGLYRIAANNLGVAVNAAKVLDVGVGGLGVVGVVKNGDGTVSLPAYSYTSDPDSGSYVIGANNIGVAVNATKILDIGTTGLGVVGVVKAGNGTVSLPAYSFTGDPDTGLYNIGANDIGIATNGVIAMDASASAVTFGLPVKGPAEGSGIYNTTHDVTAAEINTGHTLVTVPAARVFRLVNVQAVAYGATCTTSTSVLLKVGATTVATYTVANLVRSTLLDMTATGVTLPADGAAFTAGAAGDDLTVISDAATTAGCTGVRFVITYALD
jgi:hypothetical protein